MNVLVVAAHGLHCHWLGPYGNEWVSSPAFDALASEAVVFDHHYADDPSPAGFRTSCPASVVRLLRERGVVTVLLDDRRDRLADDRNWNNVIRVDHASHPTPGDAFIAAVEVALDQLRDHPEWLLWVETDRLLPPWDFDAETYQHYASATERFTATDETESKGTPGAISNPTPGRIDSDDDFLWHRLHNSFAAAVTSFDTEIDILMEVLRERGLDQTAAWVFSSRYGYPLGEHGVVGPDQSRMHTELVHLPLIVRLPGHSQGMRRVSAFTQASDLAATLLDLFGIETQQPQSLMPLMSGSTTAARSVARSTAVRPSGIERGLRTSEWAFLPANPETGEPQRLYRKPDDIWEVNDVAPRHPDECDRLSALLDNEATSPKEPMP